MSAEPRATEYTLDELRYLLTAAARTPGRKDFRCAADVVDALSEAIPAAEPVPPGQPSLALLMGVSIIRESAFEPGRFRMVRHDRCDVDVEARTVSHGRCPVIADGIVRFAS